VLKECPDKLAAANAIRQFTYVTYLNERLKMLAACPLPCKQQSYTVNLRKYHKNTWIEYDDQPGKVI